MPKRKPVRKKAKSKSRKTARTKTKKKAGSKKSTRGRVSTRQKKQKKRLQNITYRADVSFELFDDLRTLLIKALPESFPELEKKLKRLGRIKLVVVTGTFLDIRDTRVDLLLVGDNIHLQRLTRVMKGVEAELGKEIRYVILSVAEFKYRYEMYDRFLRDILSLPHKKIINRLKIGVS